MEINPIPLEATVFPSLERPDTQQVGTHPRCCELQSGYETCAVLPNGNLLAAGFDNLVYIVDVNLDLKIITTLTGHEKSVSYVC